MDVKKQVKGPWNCISREVDKMQVMREWRGKQEGLKRVVLGS